MNDLRLEREQNQAGVEALAFLKRGLDPALRCGCGRLAIRHGERLPADSAIAKEHGCFAVVLRGWIFAPRVLEKIESGQLDGIGNKRGMKIEGAKRLVEGAQIVRAPEDAEQAERRIAMTESLCTSCSSV